MTLAPHGVAETESEIRWCGGGKRGEGGWHPADKQAACNILLWISTVAWCEALVLLESQQEQHVTLLFGFSLIFVRITDFLDLLNIVQFVRFDTLKLKLYMARKCIYTLCTF